MCKAVTSFAFVFCLISVSFLSSCDQQVTMKPENENSYVKPSNLRLFYPTNEGTIGILNFTTQNTKTININGAFLDVKWVPKWDGVAILSGDGYDKIYRKQGTSSSHLETIYEISDSTFADILNTGFIWDIDESGKYLLFFSYTGSIFQVQSETGEIVFQMQWDEIKSKCGNHISDKWINVESIIFDKNSEGFYISLPVNESKDSEETTDKRDILVTYHFSFKTKQCKMIERGYPVKIVDDSLIVAEVLESENGLENDVKIKVLKEGNRKEIPFNSVVAVSASFNFIAVIYRKEDSSTSELSVAVLDMILKEALVVKMPSNASKYPARAYSLAETTNSSGF